MRLELHVRLSQVIIVTVVVVSVVIIITVITSATTEVTADEVCCFIIGNYGSYQKIISTAAPPPPLCSLSHFYCNLSGMPPTSISLSLHRVTNDPDACEVILSTTRSIRSAFFSFFFFFVPGFSFHVVLRFPQKHICHGCLR